MFLRVLILLFTILIIPSGVNAANSINDFDIQVLPVEGQQNFSKGYFHVNSRPGQTLPLDFNVTNNSEKIIELRVKPVDAYTADQGGILYGALTDKDDKENILLSDMIEIEDTISVAPGGTKVVHFHVKIPDSAKGTLLGGIMLSTEDMADNFSMEENNKGGSNYEYERAGQRLVAVKLNLPEKSSSVFSLNQAKFNAAENLVTVNIKNGKSAVLENVQGTYTIMDKAGESVVSGVVKSFSMAPLTVIDYPIDLKGKTLEEGIYVLMIKGRADGKEFLAEEKFTVTENHEASIVTASEGATYPFNKENMFLYIAMAFAALFLLLPLLLKAGKRNSKNTFLDLSDKNNI